MIEEYGASDVIGPQVKDYVLHPCGRMGSDTCVEEIGGAYIGQFGDMKLAKMAVKCDMERKKENKNMWYRKTDGTMELALGFDGL